MENENQEKIEKNQEISGNSEKFQGNSEKKTSQKDILLYYLTQLAPEHRYARYIAAKMNLGYSYIVQLLGLLFLQEKVRKYRVGQKVLYMPRALEGKEALPEVEHG